MSCIEQTAVKQAAVTPAPLVREIVAKCLNKPCSKYALSRSLAEKENRILQCTFCGGRAFELSWWMAAAPAESVPVPEAGN